jgi:transcriptional regulator with XRE-family HTH domain
MNNLKELMSAHKITQTGLSARTGVPQPTINRFVSGKTKSMNYEMLRKLASYFEVTVDYLHGYETVADKPRNLEE